MFPFQRVIGGSTRALGFYETIELSGQKAQIISAKKRFESGTFGFKIPKNTIYLDYPLIFRTLISSSSTGSNWSGANTSSLGRAIVKKMINYSGLRDVSILISKRIAKLISFYMENQEKLNLVCTCPPYWLLSGVVKSKSLYGDKLNFILDIRDSWNSMLSNYSRGLSKVVDSRIKRSVMDSCDHICCATEGMKIEIDSMTKSLSKKAIVVENGFFVDDYSFMNAIEYSRSAIPRFIFGGSLDFTDKRNSSLRNVLNAFEKLRIAGMQFRVLFLGNIRENDQFKDLREKGVVAAKIVDHLEYLEHLKKADFLLNVTPNDERGFEAMGSKTYEYIAAKKPIVALTQNGSPLSKLITKLGIGVVADINDEQEVFSCLLKMITDFKDDRLNLCVPNEEQIMSYSRESQNRKLLELLI